MAQIKISQIIDSAAELATVAQNLNRFNAERAVLTGAEIARGTALESLFDGAEFLNIPANRALVHHAFVQTYDLKRSEEAYA